MKYVTFCAYQIDDNEIILREYYTADFCWFDVFRNNEKKNEERAIIINILTRKLIT